MQAKETFTALQQLPFLIVYPCYIFAWIMKLNQLYASTLIGAGLLTGGLLSSCDDENTAPATVAAPRISTDTTAARAQLFPALAYLPQGTDTYITGNVKETIAVVNKLAGKTIWEIPLEVQKLDTFAVGITNGTESMLSPLMELICTGVTMVDENGDISHTDQEKLLRQAIALLKGVKPLYLVVTAETEDEAKTAMAEINFALALAGGQAPFIKLSKQQDWQLYTCKLSDIPQDVSEIPAELLGDLAVSIATRRQGNAVVIALTVNPEELKTAPTAADSVLGTAAAQALDAATGAKGLAALSISPDILNAFAENAVKAQKLTLELADSLFKQADDTHTEQLVKDAHVLCDLFAKYVPTVKVPISATLWQDGNLHLSLQGDACGIAFTEASVNAQAPEDALVYAYGSTVSSYPCPTMAETDTIVSTIAHIIELTESRGEAELLRSAYADAKEVLAHARNISDALGNGWCAVFDGSAVQKRHFDSARFSFKTETAAPCFAAAVQLNNRAKFESAVADTYQAMMTLAEKYAPDSIEMIEPIFTPTIATQGSVTTYTLDAIADEYNGIIPCAMLTDSAVSVGTTPAKAQYLSTTANGNTPVSGFVVHVNLAPALNLEKQALQNVEKRLAELQNAQADEYDIQWAQYSIDAQKENIQEIQHLLNIVSDATITCTAEAGILNLYIKANTPVLK